MCRLWREELHVSILKALFCGYFPHLMAGSCRSLKQQSQSVFVSNHQTNACFSSMFIPTILTEDISEARVEINIKKCFDKKH